MRSRLLILLGLAAVAAGGCGNPAAEAVAYTCGQLRDDGAAYRAQARLMVDREGLRPQTLWSEEALLDVELRLRQACRGASDGYRPYVATRDALSQGPLLDTVPGG